MLFRLVPKSMTLDDLGRFVLICMFYVARRCKLKYLSKFTAASRGSACDSTAFLFHVVTGSDIRVPYARRYDITHSRPTCCVEQKIC